MTNARGDNLLSKNLKNYEPLHCILYSGEQMGVKK